MSLRRGEPVFVISVAARLLEMHPQTLRKYEREGLIAPSRSAGNLRLYSDRDIERLRQVKYLVEQRGLNLAGVQIALELTHRLRATHTSARAAEQADPAASIPAGALCQEIEDLLTILGFVEESDPTVR